MCLVMPIRFWGPRFESFRALPRTARKHTVFTILLGNAKALAANTVATRKFFSGSKLATVSGCRFMRPRSFPRHYMRELDDEIALLQLRAEQLLIQVPPNSQDAAAARKEIDQMTQSLIAAQRASDRLRAQGRSKGRVHK
jgi:FAD/FMN-containing dehydrogenase